MKTIKDLKDAIKDIPDDMPLTMYCNGAVYRNDIFFMQKKLWHDGKHTDFFVIDWMIKKKEDISTDTKDGKGPF